MHATVRESFRMLAALKDSLAVLPLSAAQAASDDPFVDASGPPAKRPRSSRASICSVASAARLLLT